MDDVGVEAFLRFWSHYNTLIIEILIGLILLTVVYLAFRAFFGADEDAAVGAGSELKTGELEKTLRKILEKQESGSTASAAPADLAASTPASESGGSATAGEVDELRKQLAERERLIAEIKETAATPAAQTLSADEKKNYEDRLKDLEARLAEYEIISEDIADLSFYKEENAKLQKEISTLKETKPAASEPVAVVNEPEPSPAPPEPLVAPSEPSVADILNEAMPAPAPAAAAVEPEPPAAPAQAASATPEKVEPAAPSEPTAEAVPLPKAEEADLMNQFENFVKKG